MDVRGFGREPLESFHALKQRRQAEFLNYFSISNVFKKCVNDCPRMLQNAALFFIRFSDNLIDLI